MAITCPKCRAEFDATLFQFGHGVRCDCGAEIEYPGTDLQAGHILVQPPHDSKQTLQIARAAGNNLSPT